MRTKLFALILWVGLLVSAVAFFATTTPAALTSNSFTAFLSGSWQTSNSWSLAVPPSTAQSAVLLTNQFLVGTSKTITINGTTATSFPSTMTVSNLVVLGASAIGGSPPLGQNILFLDNTGSAAFTVLNSLVVSNDGVVFITDSVFTSSRQVIGNLGSLFLTGGTNNFSNGFLAVGDGAGTGVVWMTGGAMLGFNVSVNPGGLLVQSNGVIGTSNEILAGDWLQAGGINGTGLLIISNTTASAVMSGGQLLATNGLTDGLHITLGAMTVSNGVVNMSSAAVATWGGRNGTLNVAGGSLSFGSLQIAVPQTVGTIWMTGGNLTITGILAIADSASSPGSISIPLANGVLIQSNGNLFAHMEIIGNSGQNTPLADGTLTIAGGTHQVGTGGMQVGTLAFGTVWLTGGQLIVTNGSTFMGDGGDGEMTVSNGTWIARDVLVGGSSSEGTLTFLGGSSTILSNMNLGNCGAVSLGSCRVSGGSLFVTNAAHNAVLNVRNSDLLITAGHLVVDTLVMTNDCSLFIHAGGTVSIGSLLLDPDLDADGDGLPNGWELAHGLDPLDSIGVNGADGDPDHDGYTNLQEYLAGSDPQNALSTPVNPLGSFTFTSIVQSGNDIVLNWQTIGGSTNQVQVMPGGADGSYSTNGFINLDAPLFISGSGAVTTNFTDIGGATNTPSRFYRVRLVP